MHGATMRIGKIAVPNISVYLPICVGLMSRKYKLCLLSSGFLFSTADKTKTTTKYEIYSLRLPGFTASETLQAKMPSSVLTCFDTSSSVFSN